MAALDCRLIERELALRKATTGAKLLVDAQGAFGSCSSKPTSETDPYWDL